MLLTFYGAAQTVTGSQYLLEVNGKRLLLECGLFQGKRDESYIRNLTFHFLPSSIDAAILSHAHLDHCGNYPNLVKHGFRGKIYTTKATAEIADLVVRDSGHIQESDAAFVNKKRAKRGEPPMEPLYTAEDAAAVKPLFAGQDYNQPFEPIPGVTARLVDAGHILGSAAVVLDIEEKGRKQRLWFSGDIGRPHMPLLCDPVMPQDPDTLVMECTYGDKPHRNPDESFAEFARVVERTINRRGKVIVPAFAVGRTQELVYCLNKLNHSGDLPEIPVFVDSPLAVEASKVFTHFPDYYDEETRQFMKLEQHPALSFPGLHYVSSVDESKSINEMPGPLVIISASGMCESGRILHHLRNNIEDKRNTIVIVSWQAPETLGRRLAEQAPSVKIFGEVFPRHAEVATIGGLSAHGGQDVLLEYARAGKSSLKHIYLVHGEQAPVDAFRARLVEESISPVTWPQSGDAVTL